MAKEEGPGLLAKVAKFVRNPLVDWAELDGPEEPEQSSTEGRYSREALKDMIERRQRNDFVRRREFDALRKLRQREAESARASGEVPSSFHLSSAGKTDGRALTLKKIDEIEQQMSQQWWRGKTLAPGDDAAIAERQSDHMASQHARAYADTSADDEGRLLALNQPALAAFTPNSPLEEAADLFAAGDETAAESLLQQVIAASEDESEEAWLGLMDLYRVNGDSEKFGALSMRYVQRFRKPSPEWVSVRMLARLDAGPGEADSPIAWYSSERLTRSGLLELTQALGAAGPIWRMDWRALKAIEPDAMVPLGILMTHWANSPVQIELAGAERLLAVVAERTPLAERNVDPAWWQLRLSTLRVMHREEDYEFVGLNYCLTYEDSPPLWQAPGGSYAIIGGAGARRKGGAQADDDANAGSTDPYAHLPRLAGEVTGDAEAVMRRLDAELTDMRDRTVSCAALIRIDHRAAVDLLYWAQACDARGLRVELTQLHRLTLAFLQLVGVGEHAQLTPRH